MPIQNSFSCAKGKINLKSFFKDINDKIGNNSVITSATLGALEEFINKFSKNTDFKLEQKELTRHNVCHGRIKIPDSQIKAIKYFANIYNLLTFLSMY